MFFRKKVYTIPNDPALPADVREFAEKHKSNTNIVQLLNEIYERFDRNPIARAKLYASVTNHLKDLIHEDKRQQRRKHLIKLLCKKKAAI